MKSITHTHTAFRKRLLFNIFQSSAFIVMWIALNSSLTHTAQGQICAVNPPSDFWNDASASIEGFASGSIYSGNAEVTGTFTIDVTLLTFAGANLRMTSNSRILVNPSCTLRILNGSVLTALQFQWEGIEVLPGGRLEVVNSSICGARNAIFADNAFSTAAASLDIRSSQLIRNQTGVRMLNYTAGSYPFYMVSTQILGGTLPSGATTLRSSRGVYGSRLGSLAGPGIVIGDPAAGTNLFKDLDMGIELIQTWTDVYNNRFEGMQDINGFGEGWGVWVNRIDLADLELNVGDAGSGFGNEFFECRFGVSCRGYDNFRIRHNQFSAGSALFESGIRVVRVHSQITIQNNQLEGFTQLGIFLDDNPGAGGSFSTAIILSNELEGSLGTSQAILVDEFSGSLDVRNNVISEVFRGVGLQNVSTQPFVRFNNISFAYPGSGVTTDPAAGIYLLQTEQAKVNNNDLFGNCPFPFGGGPCTTGTVANRRIRGIQLINTLGSLVEANEIRDCGVGLIINSANNEGNALCNRFIDNFTGLLWDAMPSGAFGVTPGGGPPRVAPALHEWSENRWESTLSGYLPFRSWSINSADAFSVRWFHRDLPVVYDMPILLMFDEPASSIPNALIGTPTIYCFNDTLEPPEQSGSSGLVDDSSFWEDELEAVLDGTSSDGFSPGLYAHLRAAHRLGNATLQEQHALEQTAIVPLDSLRIRIYNHSLADMAWMDGISPTSVQEALLLEVFGMKVKGLVDAQAAGEWLDWQDYLSELESIRLESISEMDPALNGEAVIWAQSFLNRSLLRDNWAFDEISERRAPLAERPSLLPNPSNGTLWVNLPWAGAQVLVYDLQGRVVHSQQVEAAQIEIKLPLLPEGLYFLQATSAIGEQWSERFVYQLQ